MASRSPRTQLTDDYGLKQGFLVRYRLAFFAGVVAVLTLTSVALALLRVMPAANAQGDTNPFALVTVGAAIAGALLAYQQWWAARTEVAFDKFYERLNYANQRFMEWPAARAMMIRTAPGDEREMYVYTELDNLEYAVEKYRIGFMGPDTALRAVHTFEYRCKEPRFACRAKKVINHHLELERTDYSQHTCDVAKKVFERVGAAGGARRSEGSLPT